MVQTFRPDVDDLQLIVTLKEGRCKVEFIGCIAPRELRYMQKAISDQYRAERKKIALSYRKSTTFMKKKTQELQAKEQELKQRELDVVEKRINEKPDALLEMAKVGEAELNKTLVERGMVKSKTGVVSDGGQTEGSGQRPDASGDGAQGQTDGGSGNSEPKQSSDGTPKRSGVLILSQAESRRQRDLSSGENSGSKSADSDGNLRRDAGGTE